MSPRSQSARPRRRRLTPLALITGAAGAVVLALSMNSSLAAFTASITNSANSLGAGTLVMQEANSAGTVTCNSTDGTGNNVTNNAYTCTTINKYGGSTTLVPGTTTTTTITIKNTGTVPATTFTLNPGSCAQAGGVTGSAADLCSKIGVVITQTVGGTTTTITPASSTLTSIGSGGALALAAPVAAGQTITYSFAVTLLSTVANTYQGLTASQPLVWTFTS